MKKNLTFLLAFIMLAFTACNDDNNEAAETNAVAFVNPSVNLSESTSNINIVFLAATQSSGTVTLNITTGNVLYGTDFTTVPAAINNTVVIPFEEGVTSVSFTFNKLSSATEGQEKNVVFTIAAVSPDNYTIPEETKLVQLNFNEVPVASNTSSPLVGGANVPNGVYVDLSSGISTPVERTKWDLGFYSGTAYRVVINSSLKMAVKKLEQTDITLPVTADDEVNIGEGGGTGIIHGNPAYVDGPSGDITATAIAEVSSNEAENKVYLLNMGFGLSTTAPAAGSVNPFGASRGWKKIRILRSGNDYKLQYADIEATTFSEVVIPKNNAYNFSFFSIANNTIVSVEPEKAKWDLQFTPFVNLVNFGTGLVSYVYQDFIITNRNGGTKAYQVLNSAGVAYADFTLAHVVTANLDTEAASDQRVIGANWRNGGGPTSLPSVKDDRFYVVRDAAGHIYKVRFIAMSNAAGERGFPTFEYKLLQ